MVSAESTWVQRKGPHQPVWVRGQESMENVEDHSAVTQVGTWRSPAGLLSDS